MALLFLFFFLSQESSITALLGEASVLNHETCHLTLDPPIHSAYPNKAFSWQRLWGRNCLRTHYCTMQNKGKDCAWNRALVALRIKAKPRSLFAKFTYIVMSR